MKEGKEERKEWERQRQRERDETASLKTQQVRWQLRLSSHNAFILPARAWLPEGGSGGDQSKAEEWQEEL